MSYKNNRVEINLINTEEQNQCANCEKFVSDDELSECIICGRLVCEDCLIFNKCTECEYEQRKNEVCA